MKNPCSHFTASLLAIALGTITLVTGCGKTASKPNVDLQAQLQVLKGTDNNAKADALVEIAKLGKDAAPAVPTLIEALKSPDPLVRRLAAYALGEIGPPAASAVPVLRTLMEDGTREVVTSALNAIRSIDPKAIDPNAKLPNVQ